MSVELGRQLREVRMARGLTLQQVAGAAGTSVPTLSDYERGKKEPRLSTLNRIVRALDSDLVVRIVPAGLSRAETRHDRRSLAMHRSVAHKLLDDPEGVREHARRNLDHLREVHADGSADRYLDRWSELLDGPIDDLVDVLTSDRQSASDLRHVSPFAGVLTEHERQRALAAVP